MGQRVQTLITQFAQVNEAIRLVVASCTEAQWQIPCSSEGWSVGVTVHHIANGYDQEGWVAEVIAAILAGQALPAHPAELHPDRDYNEWNAQHFAACSQDETLALLQRNEAAALRLIESLQEEDLDKTAPASSDGDMISVQQVIENILIDHTQEHLRSLRATLERG